MNLDTLDRNFLTGLSSDMLQQTADAHLLHQLVIPALNRLAEAMAQDGIKLKIVSAWRGFERQASIWQAKCEGRRAVFNSEQQVIDISKLQGLAKLEAIMLYSALPGASRHHWGTELDIYDAAAVPADYQPQLQAAEYAAGGPFHKLSLWLAQHAKTYGFFLPYQRYQGGVAAEPWHISYWPVANRCQAAYNLNLLQTTLSEHPIAEQQNVLTHLPALYERFIINICEHKT
ncbi:M15 family metallopeptidase [Alishewanella sp. d11]|uniref:M15 family metallopeptidase n=1 Tax=Alishewanella sp. d11 TaxID=3414030 RepID=UPI003BF82AFE